MISRRILTLASAIGAATIAVFASGDEPPPDVNPLWLNSELELPFVAITDVPQEPEGGGSSFPYISAMTASPAEELIALADALGNDPVRIFNHVRNRIDYEHYYGLRKGAILTMMEGSGNDADQCALLAELLRAAGYTQVKFRNRLQAVVYEGNNGKNLMDWMGLASEPYPGRTLAQAQPSVSLPAEFNGASEIVKKRYEFAVRYLGNGGTSVAYDPANLTLLYINRIWLELTIAGTTYRLDPAFKRYERIAGVELLTSSLYNRTNFLNSAGGTTGSNYVQSLDNGNISNQLTSLTTAILAKIQNDYPNATIEQIMKGRRIIPEEISSLADAFPLGTSFAGSNNEWTEIPDTHQSKVQFVSGSMNHTIRTAELAGRRISLSFDGNNVRLWLDDTQVATTTSTASEISLTITASHSGTLSQLPVAQRSESKTYKKGDGFTYAIIYGFRASGKQLQKRYEVLEQYKKSGLLDNSREIRAELLNIMGLTWLYQTELVDRLLTARNDVLRVYHHRFGRMAQEQGFYVDVGLQYSATFQDDGDEGARKDNVFHLGSLFGSALEHGIIEQMQPGTSAVSTVNIIRKANTGNQMIYLADSSNWAVSGGVRSQLQNYSQSVLTTLNAYISSGAKLFLPRNATVAQGNWTGTGYVVRSSSQAGMIISGGYSGGYSTSYGTVSSPWISTSSFYNPTYNYTSASIPKIPTPPPSIFTPSFHGSDPVDMATGAFVFGHTDMTTGVSAAPEGLEFSRHYSTASAQKDAQYLGYGWTHALHLRALKRTATEEALGLGTPHQAAALITAYLVGADLYRADATAKEWGVASLAVGWYLDQMKDNAVSISIGHQSFQFIKQPDGSYTPPPGSTMGLQKVNEAYRLSQRLGNVIEFDVDGKGRSITDPDGRTLIFSYYGDIVESGLDYEGNYYEYYPYEGDDRIAYVRDAYERTYTFHYNAANRIERVVDSTDNREVFFRYDSVGNLDRVTDPEGKYFHYDYSLVDDPTGEASKHRIRRIRNHDDEVITVNIFDTIGRVGEQHLHGDSQKKFTLKYTGYANTETDPTGGVTTYYYDNRGRASGTRDAAGKVNRWTYDGQDHIVTRTSPANETTIFHYDGRHNLTKIEHPRGGGETNYVYDALGRLDLVTDAEGNVTDHVYFPSGPNAGKNRPYQVIDPVGTTTFEYYSSGLGAKGKLWKTTDGQGLFTEFAYDEYGQPDWVKAPGGFKTDYKYTARGDLDYEDDPNLVRTDYTHNKRRQVTQIVSNYGGPDAATEDFEYNNVGLLKTVTAPSHNDGMRSETRNVYSPTEHLRFTYLKNDTLTLDDDLVSETRYDKRDWPEKVLDAAARETSLEHYSNGKVWKTSLPLSRQSTDVYDADGRPTSKTVPGSPSARTVGFAYSVSSGAPDDVTNGYPKTVFTDADTFTTISEHDRLGQLRFLTNKDKKTFELRYDGLGRRTHIITPLDATNSRAHQIAYTHRGAPTLVTEPSGQTASYAYHPVTGRLSSITYSDGTNSETVSYSLYDDNGNLKTVSEGAFALQRTYDNLNRVKTFTDTNNQQVQYRYYPNGALRMLIYPGGNETTSGHVEYTYYQTGRLKSVIDRLSAPTTIRTTTYYWHDDGRLARVVRPNGTERKITYDGAGRPELIEEFATFASGPARLIAAYKQGYHPSDEVEWSYQLPKPRPLSGVPGAVASMTYHSDNSLDKFELQSVTHDPDGNMTNGPLPSGVFGTYDYNLRNRLRGAGGVTCTYDPEGNRISTTDATSGTTTYLVENNLGVSKVLARTKGGQTTRYVWGAGLLYEVTASGEAIYYHFDQMGSTTALSDASGTVLERIEYAPFGWITDRQNTSGTLHDTPFLFTGFFGNQTDANGLVHMRERYYNPLTRRFLNSDPAREGNNWFAYAAGNPLAFVDPTGLGIASALDSVQTALTFLGLVPIVGEVFDLVNAGISLARGNYGEAAIHAASALPGLGMAIGGATLGVKYGGSFIRAFEGPLASLGRAQLSRGGAHTISRDLQRIVATPVRYAPVNSTAVGRALNSTGNFQQHHVFIQQKTFQATSPSRLFPNNASAQRGLARIGNAGANLMPIPAALNNYLGRSPRATGALAGWIAGEPFRIGYDSWKIGTAPND